MPATASVSVEEYLTTTYDPDRDYVDGEVLERNWGEVIHGRTQLLIAAYVFSCEEAWDVTVTIEVRVQVKPRRFRVPDITVVAGPVPETRILREPPLLCVEVLSPEDRMERMQEKIEDYLAFGVRCVWVVNPRNRRGFIYTSEGMHEAKDGVLRVEDTPIEVPLAGIG